MTRSMSKFWKSRYDHAVVYNGDNRLPHVFRDELRPIFERLLGATLLERCWKGLTRNQNEAINQILWKKCPNNSFCSKRRVVISTCQSILQFNGGSTCSADIRRSLGVEPGHNFFSAKNRIDANRIVNSTRKVATKERFARKYRRT